MDSEEIENIDFFSPLYSSITEASLDACMKSFLADIIKTSLFRRRAEMEDSPALSKGRELIRHTFFCIKRPYLALAKILICTLLPLPYEVHRNNRRLLKTFTCSMELGVSGISSTEQLRRSRILRKGHC